MSWWAYVQRTAQTDRQRDIAEKTGIENVRVEAMYGGERRWIAVRIRDQRGEDF